MQNCSGKVHAPVLEHVIEFIKELSLYLYPIRQTTFSAIPKELLAGSEPDG